MRKLLITLAVLAMALPVYGRVRDLFVGVGTETPAAAQGVGTVYAAGSIETDGVLILDAANAIAPDDVTPSVAGGNIFTTGINTGATVITDLDNPYPGATYTLICGSIAGGFQSTIADAGNFTLDGAWAPATVGDSIMLFCRADNDYVEVGRAYAVAGPIVGDPFAAGPDAVGGPGFTWIGALTDGMYHVGAGDIGIACGGVQQAHIDATGVTAVGFNGPLGTVVPAAATVTDLNVTGDSTIVGQTPADLVGGYKGRGDYITYINTFDEGTDTELADQWDIATLVVGGGSSVTELTTDGWVTLATGGGGGPDSAGIRTNGLNHYPAYAPRIETVVDLGTVAAGSNNFYFGFWAAANRFVEIIFEPATSANWLLRVDDTAGAETEDSGVAATVNPTKLEIAITAGGVVSWAIDDVAMPVTGITNLMANAHYARAYLLDVAAAGHTAEIDWFMSEQLRQQ